MSARPRIEPYLDLVPVIGEHVWVDPDVVILGDVTVGRRSTLWPGAVLRGDQGAVVIGEETSIQDGVIAHATLGLSTTEIGSRCTVGHRAVLHGCVVEDDCLIGIGAVLLDGCRIGRFSVIAAGALIPPGKVIPPRSMVVGVPGRIVRTLSDGDIDNLIRHGRLEYLRLGADYGGFPPHPDVVAHTG
jgi:gamma-carbonic anhydrase